MIRAFTLCLATATAMPAFAQEINFGDDSGDYARDGVCDDRRFVGSAMSATLDWAETGRDASDCRSAFDDGALQDRKSVV